MTEDKKMQGTGVKLLVVDDQEGVISFLYDFFTAAGYEVIQATNAKKAVQAVKNEHPALVLLDIKLGWGRNGLEVLREVKQVAPETKVIMMTSVDDEDVVQEAYNLGAADYIVKPFSLSYLRNVVTLKMLSLQINRIGRIEKPTLPDEKNI